MRIGRGLVLWAGVVLAWLVPASISAGSEFFRELVVTQNLTRYTAGAAYVGTRGHLHPWHYYLPVLALALLPWTLFLPAAGTAILRFGDRRVRRGTKLLLCWAGVTILFFSLSPAKRSVYVLQMYPALALVLGAGIALLGRDARIARRWLGLPLAGFAVVTIGAGGAVWLLGGSRPEAALVPSWLPLGVAAVFAVLAVGVGAAAGSAARGRPLHASAWSAVGVGLAALVAVTLLPALDPIKSVRTVAEMYRDRAGPEEPYGFFPAQEPALQFYSGRIGVLLETEDQAREFLERRERVWLFVERGALRRIAPLITHLREVGRGSDPENGYALYVSSVGRSRDRDRSSSSRRPGP